MNTMGQFIAALRKANGMTQQELADRLNVSNKSVSRWECDQCAPDISLIPAIAELFNVTCDELLKGERIAKTDNADKKEQKVEQQAKSLILRVKSKFRTQLAISIGLAMVGLVLMFGISYGFFRPVIAFTAMLMFEIAALIIAIIAVQRAREVSQENGIFEQAGSLLTAKLNKFLANTSYAAFFTVFSAIALSLPLILASWESGLAVLSSDSYFAYFFGIIALVLVLTFLLTYMPYNYFFGRGKREKYISKEDKTISFIQIAMIVFGGLAINLSDFIHSTGIVNIISALGLLLLLAAVVIFIVFLVKKKEGKRNILLLGIRNILFIPSAFIALKSHSTSFTSFDQGVSWERDAFWNPQYLLITAAYIVVVIIAYLLIDRFVKAE